MQRVDDLMSDEFDAILDRCLADLALGRDTIESCVRRYPAHAGHLQALLPLAATLRAGPAPAPLPLDKRRALETRLLRQAGTLARRPAANRATRRSVFSGWQFWPRGAALVAVSLVVCLLLLTSTVSASAASLPGDSLYPIKRAAEQVRVAFTAESNQAALHLELAQTRLQELDALAQRGDVSTDSLTDLDAEMAAVLQRVAQLPVQQQSALLLKIDAFQNEQAQALTWVAGLARGEKQGKAQAALSAFVAKREVLKGLMLKASIPIDDTGPAEGANPQPTEAQTQDHTPQGNGPQGNGPQGNGPQGSGSQGGGSQGGNPPGGVTSKLTPKPTAMDNPAATERPTAEPKPTKETGPQPAPKATKPPPSNSNKPTPKAKDNSPGQGNTSPGSPPVHATKAPKNK